MSKQRPAAVAAVRRKLASYTTARWPTAGTPNTTLELLSGAEMVGGSVLDDLDVVLSPLVAKGSPHRLTPPLRKAIRAALAGPKLDTIRAVETACWAIVSLAEDGRSPVLVETLRVVEDLGERCAVWLAAIGCPVAAQRCAVLCMRYSRQRNSTSFVDVITHGLMRSMIDYLIIADLIEVYDVESYVPESRHIQINVSATDAARGLVHVLGVVQEAIDLGEPEREDRGLEGLSDLDALDAIDKAAVSEDRAGIKRLPAKPEPEDGKTYGAGDLPPPSVPAMVVVGDVSHVKKGSKGDHDPVKDAEAIVGKRLPLVTPPGDLSETRAELVAEFPQLARVVDRLLRPLAMQDTIRVPHVLLWGPPGAGKTRFARRFAEVLDLSPAVYPMGGVNDSMALAGVARGWSTGGFCAPVRELIRTRIANPLIVVDEVDKVGTSRHNGNSLDVLVNLLGTETAARYRDPYLQADVDLSRVGWILTANSLDGVPRPLLDRCLVLRVDEPGPEHLRTLATSILADVRADRGLDEQWAPPFDGVEWQALEEHWPGGSLRALRRLVETVLDARDAGPRQ